MSRNTVQRLEMAGKRKPWFGQAMLNEEIQGIRFNFFAGFHEFGEESRRHSDACLKSRKVGKAGKAPEEVCGIHEYATSMSSDLGQAQVEYAGALPWYILPILPLPLPPALGREHAV